MLQIPYEVFRYPFNPFQNHLQKGLDGTMDHALSSSSFGNKKRLTCLPTGDGFLEQGATGITTNYVDALSPIMKMGTIILIVDAQKNHADLKKKAIWRILEMPEKKRQKESHSPRIPWREPTTDS